MIRGRRAIAVKCLLLFLLLLAMTHGEYGIVRHYVVIHRPLTALVILGVWAASVGATFCVALLPRPATRCAWALILGLAGLVSSGYFAVCKIPLGWDAFLTLWQTMFMAGAAVDTYGSTLAVPGLLALCLIAVIALPPTVPRMKNRWLAILPLIPVLLVFQVIRVTSGAGLDGLPAPYYSLGLAAGLLFCDSAPEHGKALAEALQSSPRVRNILFIVDESVRGDFIDLNRDRGITPYLKSIRGRLINFGAASSAANCSSESNAILRMGANPAALINGSDIRANPTIWLYAHKAGFKNVFIDDQRTNGKLINYMDPAERKLVDEFIQPGGPIERRDFGAIPIVSRLLREPGRHFIYINKQGAHFPYQSGYPKEETLFSPNLERFDETTDRVRLNNSYKNAIHWTVDTFFRELNEQSDLRDTLVVYTSDHGQNLLDDGIPLTHCRADHPISEEAWVPLLLFSHDERLAADLRKAARLNHDRVSAFQIFPTLLQVMGYDPIAARKNYYLTLFDRVETPLGFASGGIFRVFGGKAKWNSFRLPGETADRKEKSLDTAAVSGSH
jgi:hypothetical protein